MSTLIQTPEVPTTNIDTSKELKEIWEKILLSIKPHVPHGHFLTWFCHTALTKYDTDTQTIHIGAPNNFVQNMLEQKFYQLLLDTANHVGCNCKNIIIHVQTDLNSSQSTERVDTRRLAVETKRVQKTRRETTNYTLNIKYSFDNFIIGDHNRLAAAACQKVADAPGESFNPLFIYSHTGLGKTHLLQATGNAIISKYRQKKVLYITAESLCNEIVSSIQARNINQLKNTYRNVDVLIIDDIQFIAGKGKTQEIFFHTFNALHNYNRQIIISSDVAPKQLHDIEDRLLSRFESGILLDIDSPDFETRLAILRHKSQERGVLITSDILEYIAMNTGENIRELEGVLTQVIAESTLTNIKPSIAQVAKHLAKNQEQRPPSPTRNTTITPNDILQATAHYFQISIEDMVGISRKREIIGPRQLAMYILRSELNCSLEKIGKMFGNKNHSTVMHSISKISDNLSASPFIIRDINCLKSTLGLV